ncbi:MAG: hypothetical protein H8D67_12710 [Deltaproteobacteria bacterium]|nr:hypothetical protein [Deltaproteobacteria bacterium]
MITGTILKAAVIGNLELNNDSTTETRFRVYANINAALRTVLRTFPLSQIDNAIKTATFNLLQDISAYQWPADFVRFVRMWVDYSTAMSQTNHGNEATPAWESQFYGNSLDQRPLATAPRVDIVEGGFDIRPVPASALANGGRLKYVYLQPDISDSQNCLLREDLYNAIVFEGTSLCMKIDGYNIKGSIDYHDRFKDELVIFGGSNVDV